MYGGTQVGSVLTTQDDDSDRKQSDLHIAIAARTKGLESGRQLRA